MSDIILIQVSPERLTELIAQGVEKALDRRPAKLHTKKEAAKILGIGYKKLQSLITAGTFHLRPGNLISSKEIDNVFRSDKR